jgi:hypothetical protein
LTTHPSGDGLPLADEFFEAQAKARANVGPLILVETLDIVPGCIDQYVEALRQHYLPIADAGGITLVSCLRSPEGTGEHELVITWRLADWADFVRYRWYFQIGNEPATSEWVALSNSLRTGGRRRLMYEVQLRDASGPA